MTNLIGTKDKKQRGKPLSIDDLPGEDANLINLVMAVTKLVGSWSEPEVMAWLDNDVLPDSAGLLLPAMAQTVANYRIEMLMERDDSHALLNFWFAWCTNIEKALSIFLKPKAGSTRWK